MPAPSPSAQNRLTQLLATKLGARLFRMSVGMAWMAGPQNTLQARKSTQVGMQPGDVLLRQARPLRVGVEGMSDGVGFVPVVITPEMVGQTVAVYLAIEDKSGQGRPTTEQRAFIAMIRKFGGRAGVSRSDDDTAAIVAGEIRD